MRASGVSTGIFGKETNANDDTYISPGWDQFFVLGGVRRARARARDSHNAIGITACVLFCGRNCNTGRLVRGSGLRVCTCGRGSVQVVLKCHVGPARVKPRTIITITTLRATCWALASVRRTFYPSHSAPADFVPRQLACTGVCLTPSRPLDRRRAKATITLTGSTIRHASWSYFRIYDPKSEIYRTKFGSMLRSLTWFRHA